MELKDITEEDIEMLADSDAILKRGRSYYNSGRIKHFEANNQQIIAKIIGHYGNYNVKIKIDGGDIDADCNCPYGGSGCKHVAAALYKWIHVKPLQKEKKQNAKLQMPELNEIISKYTKDTLIKPLEIINSKRIAITNTNTKVNATIKENGKAYNVIIEAQQYYSYNQGPTGINLLCKCSCQLNSYYSNCQHILAALLLSSTKKISKDFFLDMEKELKKQIREEGFNRLIGLLERTGGIQEQAKHDYDFKFKLDVQETMQHFIPSLALMKCAKLKSGGYGVPSNITRKFLDACKEELPPHKLKAINIFIESIKEEHWGYGSLIKNKFDKYLSIELLNLLRELYQNDPESFIDVLFPAGKADIIIATKKNPNTKDYSFNIYAAYNGQQYPITEKTILLGGKPMWIAIKGLPEHPYRYAIIESNCGNPELLRMIIQYSGLELLKPNLQMLLHKHYSQISSIGEIELPKEANIEELNIAPKARLLLSDHGNGFKIEPKFAYGSQEISYSMPHQEIIVKENQKLVRIKRDKEFENEKYNFLINNGAEERQGIILPTIGPYLWLAETSKILINAGYEIYGQDSLFNCKVLTEEPKLFLEVSSGIDWFDLKGEAEFGEEHIPLEEIRQALSKQERFIKLSDGRMGIIPQKWLERLAGVAGLLHYDQKNKKIQAAKTQIALVNSLLDISSKAKIDPAFNQIKEKFKSFNGIKTAKLPQGLKGELRNYQIEGYNWLHFLKEFSFGGCLADDMGLGKTIQVLTLLQSEKEQGAKFPSLIVVPTSLMFNWNAEIQKFTPELKAYTHHGTSRKKSSNWLPKNADVIITTYGTLRNDIEIFQKKEFNYVVLDESQSIKNPLAKNTKSAYQLKSRQRLALTGTPIENNTLELWSQFAFLNPGLLGDIDYFKSTFSKSIEGGKDKEKAKALRQMINPFLLSRKKEMVAKELPKKQVTTLYCEMDEEQRKVYESWKEKFRIEIKDAIKNEGFLRSKIKILQGLMRLRQICNHPVLVKENYTGKSGKFSLLMEQIEETISSGHKVLIFSSFVKMLHIFREQLEQKKIPFCYLDGSTKNREEAVSEFQNNGNIKAFLISLKAGGLGLNLTAADYVFIVDPWWNPAAEMQAMDRTHRIGQDKPVFVYKAITKDSVEEKILELQESKLDLVKNIITVEESIFKSLKQKDIEKIFGN